MRCLDCGKAVRHLRCRECDQKRNGPELRADASNLAKMGGYAVQRRYQIEDAVWNLHAACSPGDDVLYAFLIRLESISTKDLRLELKRWLKAHQTSELNNAKPLTS